MKNKKVTLPLAIIGGVVALIIIAVVILSVIQIQPLKSYTDFDTLRLYSDAQDYAYPDTDGGKKVKESLTSTKFSVMHAILEGKANYGFRYVTVEKDGDKVRDTLDNDGIKNFKATAGTYLLELSWHTEQTLKVNKDTVKYDRMKILVSDFGGELGYLKVVPYLYDMIDNSLEGEDSSEYYSVDKLEILASTHLYNGLKEVVEQFTK